MRMSIKDSWKNMNKSFRRFDKFNVFSSISGLYIFSFILFYVIIFKKYNYLIMSIIGWLIAFWLIIRYFGRFIFYESKRNKSLSDSIRKAKQQI